MRPDAVVAEWLRGRRPRPAWMRLIRWLLQRPWFIAVGMAGTILARLRVHVLHQGFGSLRDWAVWADVLGLTAIPPLVVAHLWVLAPVGLLAGVLVAAGRWAIHDEMLDHAYTAIEEAVAAVDARMPKILDSHLPTALPDVLPGSLAELGYPPAETLANRADVRDAPLADDARFAREREIYLAGILRRYDNVRLPIGLRAGADLPSIFQPLRLVRDPIMPEDLQPQKERRATLEEPTRGPDDSRLAEPVTMLQSAGRDAQPRRQDAADGEEALARSPDFKMVVLGGPGSGKTTLLRHLVCTTARSALHDHLIPMPVFISLPTWAKSRQNLRIHFAAIARSLDAHPQFGEALWEAYLAGSVLLCLDGLDEVTPTRRSEIERDIREYCSRSRGAVVIASRFSDYRRGQLGLDHFAEWEIQSLDHERRVALAGRLFAAMADVSSSPMRLSSESFVRGLENNPHATAWGKNPMLFSLAAVIAAEGGRLPDSRAELYSRVIDAAMEARIEERAQRVAVRRVIGELALRLYADRSAGPNVLVSDLETLLAAAGGRASFSAAYEGLLATILASGVMEPVAAETYSFRHHTFLEYLAATGLAQRLTQGTRRSRATAWRFVIARSGSARWAEVLRLTVAVLSQREGDLDQSRGASVALRLTRSYITTAKAARLGARGIDAALRQARAAVALACAASILAVLLVVVAYGDAVASWAGLWRHLFDTYTSIGGFRTTAAKISIAGHPALIRLQPNWPLLLAASAISVAWLVVLWRVTQRTLTVARRARATQRDRVGAVSNLTINFALSALWFMSFAAAVFVRPEMLASPAAMWAQAVSWRTTPSAFVSDVEPIVRAAWLYVVSTLLLLSGAGMAFLGARRIRVGTLLVVIPTFALVVVVWEVLAAIVRLVQWVWRLPAQIRARRRSSPTAARAPAINGPVLVTDPQPVRPPRASRPPVATPALPIAEGDYDQAAPRRATLRPDEPAMAATIVPGAKRRHAQRRYSRRRTNFAGRVVTVADYLAGCGAAAAVLVLGYPFGLRVPWGMVRSAMIGLQSSPLAHAFWWASVTCMLGVVVVLGCTHGFTLGLRKAGHSLRALASQRLAFAVELLSENEQESWAVDGADELVRVYRAEASHPGMSAARYEAVVALSKLGSNTPPQIMVQALGTPRQARSIRREDLGEWEAMRLAAAGTLARLSRVHDVRELLWVLDDPSNRVRDGVIDALAALGDDPPRDMLARALAHPRIGVREAAVRVLAKLGPTAPPDLIAHALQDTEAVIRAGALRASALQPQVDLRPIRDAIGAEKPRVRAAAYEALGIVLARGRASGDRDGLPGGVDVATHELLRAAECEVHSYKGPAGVRATAAYALSQLGAEAPIDVLENALHDRSVIVQIAVAAALRVTKSQRAIDVLAAFVGETSFSGTTRAPASGIDQERVGAHGGQVDSLDWLFHWSGRELDRLDEWPTDLETVAEGWHLSDGAQPASWFQSGQVSEFARLSQVPTATEAAILALGKLGAHAPLDLLERVVKSGTSCSSVAATRALGYVQTAKAVDILANIVTTMESVPGGPSPRTGSNVMAGIRRLHAGRLAPFQSRDMQKPLYDSGLRSMAITALGIAGDLAPIDVLLAALGDDNTDVRCAAVEVLGTRGDRVRVEVFIPLLEENSVEVRQAAAVAIRRLVAEGQHVPSRTLHRVQHMASFR